MIAIPEPEVQKIQAVEVAGVPQGFEFVEARLERIGRHHTRRRGVVGVDAIALHVRDDAQDAPHAKLLGGEAEIVELALPHPVVVDEASLGLGRDPVGVPTPGDEHAREAHSDHHDRVPCLRHRRPPTAPRGTSPR